MLAFVTGHVRLNPALAPATRLVLNELWDLVVQQTISSPDIDTVTLAAVQITTSELIRPICKEASWKAPRM